MFFFGNEKLVNLVNIYDTNQYLRLSSYNHFLDLKSLDYDYVIMTNMNEGFFPFTDINTVTLEESKKIKFDNKSQEEQEEYILTTRSGFQNDELFKPANLVY